jgi:GAF domain-containing protein
MVRWLGKWLLLPVVLGVYLLSPDLQAQGKGIVVWLIAYAAYLLALEAFSRAQYLYNTAAFRMVRIQLMAVLGSILIMLTGGANSYFWFVYFRSLFAAATHFDWATILGVCGETVVLYLLSSLMTPGGLVQTDILSFIMYAGVLLVVTLIFAETNKRHQSAENELRYAKILEQVQQDVDTAIGLEEVLDRILRRAVKLVKARDGSLMLLNEQGELAFQARFGESLPKGKVTHTFKPGEGVAGRVLQTRQPYVCQDTRTDRLFIPVVAGSLPIRSLVAVPIISHGRVLGVISVDSSESNRFSGTDARLLMTLADRGAVAIERAELFESLRQVGQKAQSNTEDMNQQIVASAHRLTNCPVAMWRIEETGATARICAHKGLRDRYVQDRVLDLEHSLTGQAIRNVEIIEVPDIEADPDVSPVSKIEARAQGWKSMLIVPLSSDLGQIMGALSIYSPDRRRFTSWERDLLQTFADQAAIALASLSLYQRTQQRERTLRQLVQIGQEISSLTVLEPKATLEQIARAVCEKIEADCAIIYPYDPERPGYFDTANVASYGLWHHLVLADEPRDWGVILDIRQKPDGVLMVPDVSERRSYWDRHLIQREGVQAFVGVLLYADGQEVGAFYANFRQPHQITENERVIIQECAARAVEAILTKGREVSRIQLPGLLARITQSAKEVLDADIVTLYQYYRGRDEEFITPPAVAGELRESGPMGRKIYEYGLPALLVKEGKSYWADDVTRDEFLCKASAIARQHEQPGEVRFIEREGIRSSAGVLLIAEDDIVGVMFINYRAPHRFSDEVRQGIDLFASQAAVAIRSARTVQQTQALREISQAIAAATLQPERLLDLVLEQALGLVGFSTGWISLLNPQTDVLEIKAARGLPKDRWQPLKKGRGITGHVAATGEYTNALDVSQSPFYEPVFDDTKSELCVPLKYEGRVLGILNVESTRAAAFTKRDEELMMALADAAAVALWNAQSYDQRVKDIVALQKINEAITAGDFSQVAAMIARAANELTQGAYGTLWMTDWPNRRLNLGATYGREAKQDSLLLDEHSLDGQVALAGVAYNCPDVSKEDEPYLPWYPDIKSAVTVPVKFQDEVIGTLHVESDRLAAFTEHQQRLLESLADQAAIAIENILQFEQRRKDMTALQEINEAVVSKTLAEILSLVVRRAVTVLGGEYGELWLREDETGDLVLWAVHGPAEAIALRIGRIKAGVHSIHMQVAEWGSFYICRNITEDLDRSFPIYEAAQSSVTVPLKYQGKVIGVLNVESSRLYAFAEQHAQLLQSFADQAAIAIENARLYETLEERVKERTRQLEREQDRRIAIEKWATLGKAAGNLLHRINNTTGIIPVAVQSARELLEGVALDEQRLGEISADLERIERNARHTLQLARALWKPFEAPPPEQHDINRLIEEAIAIAEVGPDIRLETRYAENPPMVRTSHLLTEVFVELITNAAKVMPGGGRLTIESRQSNDAHVEIRFEDSGPGIAAEDEEKIYSLFFTTDEKSLGFGLWWVKTFLTSQGGTIHVQSRKGEGATFIVRLPIAGRLSVGQDAGRIDAEV